MEDYFYAGLDPNPSQWKLNLRNTNLLGTLKVQTLVFDSTAQNIYMPLSDL